MAKYTPITTRKSLTHFLCLVFDRHSQYHDYLVGFKDPV